MLDFELLKKSNFFKMGKVRINYHQQSVLPDAGFCMYETTEQLYLRQDQPEITFNTPLFKWMTSLTLQKALSMRPFIYNTVEQPFIPDAFRQEIQRQFIEVTRVLDTTRNLNPNVDIKDSFLLIVEPGVSVKPHIHQVRQTLTLCYTYNETKKIPKTSTFLMGWKSKTPIELPEHREFYFTMIDDPPHEVCCSEWRFFWFNDFSDYITVPELNIPQWQNDLLLGKNLNPDDHVVPSVLNLYY